jgi:hypothetical protein
VGGCRGEKKERERGKMDEIWSTFGWVWIERGGKKTKRKIGN